jgi:bifunctional non-homologous end joining protein LigD
MLEKALSVNVLDARIRYSQHIQGDGQRMLDYAATMGIEGIMSKRADLPYRSGRGSHWLKSKCTARQEFIVIGYILSDKMSGSVGSLALGYYSTAGELVYAGRVGTGYSTKEAIAFAQGLPVIRVPKLDCLNVPADDAKNVCWIQPRFVADIEFRGWTKERLLWQPSYKVLRDDKDPAEVVLEEAGERFTPPSQPSP